MALQLFKIADVTVATPQSTVSFTSIPQGYTDLLLLFSHRGVSGNAPSSYISLNGNAVNTIRMLNGDGGTVYASTSVAYYTTGSNYTSNTFASTEFYIPNYTSSNNKSIGIKNVVENNSSACVTAISTAVVNNSAAVSSISLNADVNFSTNTTATLYGIL